MTVRNAKFTNIPAIYSMLEELYDKSVYKGRDEIEPREAKRLITNCIQRHGQMGPGGACVFVCGPEGRANGFIIGVLDRVYHIGKKLMATDLYWYVSDDASRKDAIALFDAFCDWADTNPNVLEIKPGATDAVGDYRRTEIVFKRKGFRQSGSMWTRDAKGMDEPGTIRKGDAA